MKKIILIIAIFASLQADFSKEINIELCQYNTENYKRSANESLMAKELKENNEIILYHLKETYKHCMRFASSCFENVEEHQNQCKKTYLEIIKNYQ